MRRTLRRLAARRSAALVGVVAVLAASAAGPAAASARTTAPAAKAATSAAFTRSETVHRDHLVNGADQVVDTRTVRVVVSQTTSLRDRQTINVSWAGAHPTGGIFGDVNSGAASQEEYPVVVLECRGVDSTRVPARQRLSPQTCWTSTPLERFQSSDFIFPPYRIDRYARAAERTSHPGQPNPVPAACLSVAGSTTRWVPFVAANGHAYYGGGSQGCAGIPPEAVTIEGAVPSNQTYGVSDTTGHGSAKFVVQTADTNASLGCTDTVRCSLVVIPVMGISCDATAAGLPADDQPGTFGVADQAFQLCSRTGVYQPGQLTNGGANQEDLAVAGALWWSASNWRNRITVPLSFLPSPTACSVLNTSKPVFVYGSESMLQATLQWGPKFCLDSKLFKFQHVQTSEPQAKNLLETGTVEAAFQASPPQTPFSRPVVQAPVAATGFAIGYDIDGVNGHPYVHLRLTPRLLAKLLTESYPSNATVRDDLQAWDAEVMADPILSDSEKQAKLRRIGDNPMSMAFDPEFRALNPGIPETGTFFNESASTLLALASDSDVTWALTSYINSDPEARAWLDGAPDPWGMVVNPAYRGIKLPVTNWPLLDTFEPPSLYRPGFNDCLAASPVPWLPLVASPVSQLSTITLDMQYAVANSQIKCVNPASQAEKLSALGRQIPGGRFMLGVISLPDAKRYEIDTAELLTHVAPGAARKFVNASGRTFVGPSDASLAAAARMMAPVKAAGSWPVPYARLHSATAGSVAYPGFLLLSMDVPTTGLPKSDAEKYAKLLRFAATSGQSQGLGIGQLPPGFLPMTTANGLGAEAAYTLAAAKAVAAQDGSLPYVTGGSAPGTTGSGGTGSGSGSGTGTGTGSSGGSGTPTGSTGKPPSPSPSPSPSPAHAEPVVAVGVTSDTTTGAAGLVLPLVLIAAAAALLAIPLTAAVGRRRVQE
jgi:hypothetical protein